jgi:hypothetical protein
MRRRSTVALLAALIVMAMTLGASAALAGEVTGSGQGGPDGDGAPGATESANSICAFSGLNDDPDDPRLFEGGLVQSFGNIIQEAIDTEGFGYGTPGASALVPLITEDGPGAHCQG